MEWEAHSSFTCCSTELQQPLNWYSTNIINHREQPAYLEFNKCWNIPASLLFTSVTVFTLLSLMGCVHLKEYSLWFRFICLIFFYYWCNSPQWVMASLFTRFLDHTQRRTTFGRTPLDEWSARSRDLYLTTQTLTTDRYPCPRWGSNPQSQQASGRRPTP